jgi:tetratricopeptide (TPR) repeat protein
MIRARHNTLLLFFLSIVVLGTIVLVYAEPLTDGDIWFHLAYGRYFFENHTIIPDHSIFSWTPADNTQIYCAWIPESIFYLLFKGGDLYLLYALRYLFIIIFTLLVFSLATKNHADFLPATLLIYLTGLLVSHPGLFIKAELFSFIFMTMIVWTWFRIKTRPDKTRYLFYLFPLSILLWVNSHGGFIFGILFLGLVFVGEVINWLCGSSEKLDPQDRKHLFISMILSGLSLLITPYGWRYPVQLLNNLFLNPEALHRHMNSITAYYSIFDQRVFQLDLIVYLITSSGILAILMFTQIRKSKIDWTLLLVNASFIAISIKFSRATYFGAIVLVFSSFYLIRKIPCNDSGVLINKSLKSILQIISIGLVLLFSIRAQYETFFSNNSGFNNGYSPPKDEAEYIRIRFPQLRIGNDYTSGTYLIWSLWPGEKVFIDARYFPYRKWYDEYIDFVYNKDRAERDVFIKKYNCDLWCVTYDSPEIEYFLNSPDWKLVYYGPSACIFLSSRISYPEGHEVSSSIYKVDFYHAATIASFALMLGDLDVANNFLTRLKTSHFYRKQQSIINAIELQDKKIKDNILILQKALMAQPDNPKIIQALVLGYAKIGDYENAITNLKILLNQDPEKPEVYYNIACMYAKQNMTDRAIAWLKLAIEKGFHNWELIKDDPDLVNIRKTPFMHELLEKH